MPIAVLVTAGGQHQRRHALLVFHVYLRAVVRQEPDNRNRPRRSAARATLSDLFLVAFTSSPSFTHSLTLLRTSASRDRSGAVSPAAAAATIRAVARPSSRSGICGRVRAAVAIRPRRQSSRPMNAVAPAAQDRAGSSDRLRPGIASTSAHSHSRRALAPAAPRQAVHYRRLSERAWLPTAGASACPQRHTAPYDPLSATFGSAPASTEEPLHRNGH